MAYVELGTSCTFAPDRVEPRARFTDEVHAIFGLARQHLVLVPAARIPRRRTPRSSSRSGTSPSANGAARVARRSSASLEMLVSWTVPMSATCACEQLEEPRVPPEVSGIDDHGCPVEIRRRARARATACVHRSSARIIGNMGSSITTSPRSTAKGAGVRATIGSVRRRSRDGRSPRGPVKASTPGAPSAAAASSTSNSASIDPVAPLARAGPIDSDARRRRDRRRRAGAGPGHSDGGALRRAPRHTVDAGAGGSRDDRPARSRRPSTLDTTPKRASDSVVTSDPDFTGEDAEIFHEQRRLLARREVAARRAAGSSARGWRRARRTSSGRRTPHRGTRRRRLGRGRAGCVPARARRGRGPCTSRSDLAEPHVSVTQ